MSPHPYKANRAPLDSEEQKCLDCGLPPSHAIHAVADVSTDSERAQFDWSSSVQSIVKGSCLASDHAPGPAYVRVYDFMGAEPPQRLKFTSRQCDCGMRLYVEGPAELRPVKRVSMTSESEVSSGEAV
jgi:hypothetical protein